MQTEPFTSTKNLLLTTFRKDGTPVATPVWFVIHDGELHATTLENAGKVKRIRNDPRVTVAACTVRGTPIGPTFAAHARVLPPDASAARGEGGRQTLRVGPGPARRRAARAPQAVHRHRHQRAHAPAGDRRHDVTLRGKTRGRNVPQMPRDEDARRSRPRSTRARRNR